MGAGGTGAAGGAPPGYGTLWVVDKVVACDGDPNWDFGARGGGAPAKL